MTDGLAHPVWAALRGPHRHLARQLGRAMRYPSDVAPFASLAPGSGPDAYADLAGLTGPGGAVTLTGAVPPLPAGWETVLDLAGVQLTGDGVQGAADPEAQALGAADVPEMLDLVRRTDPGPFRPRTVELGTYLGIRRGGALVAMAGERLHPPGWTEISAVCTDPAHRGQGLAGRLTLAVAAGIRARGERPFLHASATNSGAITLYERLGFVLHRRTTFRVLRAPG